MVFEMIDWPNWASMVSILTNKKYCLLTFYGQYEYEIIKAETKISHISIQHSKSFCYLWYPATVKAGATPQTLKKNLGAKPKR